MAGTAYPLKVSANCRFLIDQYEQPILVHGDTPWSLFSALNEAEVEQYLADRAAKGFNALIANLVEHRFHGPLNPHGEHPFHNPQDVNTPNERYFEFADWIVQRAADYGFLLLLAPLYLGLKNESDDEGWIHEAWRSGTAKCYQYGRFLGERYAHHQHIIWLMGGDRNPRGVVDQVNSLVQGIKSFDQHSLFAASPELEESTQETYGWGGWLDLNSMDALAAAQTSDRRTLIAYMPSARRITIDGTALAGEQVIGWWFNPRTRQSQAAGEFSTDKPLTFEPPTDGDWAFVLDDSSLQLPPPGTA